MPRAPFIPSNSPHQTRLRAPDAYENLLGDGLESAFAQGIHELEPLVASLNAQAVPSPTGEAWTAESLCSELARLGQ